MPTTHSNLAGERVVIILEGGRVINGTITSFQFEADVRETTWDDQWAAPTSRTFEPTGRHITTLTVDAEL